jgi:hypothetical protein
MPRPGEFARVSGSTEFLATRGRSEATILFRWRTTNACKCRGKIPGAVVGMWVNGRLKAHYYGWNIPEVPNHYDHEAQDLFGKGIRLWLQKTFQRQLLKAAPTFRWAVTDASLPDVYHVNDPPWLAHITWNTGERFAARGRLQTLNEAAEFTRDYLRMELADFRHVPILSDAEAAHG